MKKSSMNDRITQILKKPYRHVLVSDEETGQIHAEIAEFPGCFAMGDSREEALRNLEEAARSWIEASLKLNHKIPEPDDIDAYSGKILLRLPKSLHGRVAALAQREGVSLNHLLSSFVAESVAEKEVIKTVMDGIGRAQTISSVYPIGTTNMLKNVQISTAEITSTFSLPKKEVLN